VQGTELTLRSFLELSWFFPQQFKKEQFLETADNYFVVGQSDVYRFKKPSLGSSQHLDSFADRWRAACLKIADGAALASNLFLGLQLFEWSDGELVWSSFIHPVNLDPDFPPEEISSQGEVAIVMRRLPAENFLDKRLAEGTVSERDLRRILRGLGQFFRQQQIHNTLSGSQERELRYEQALAGVPELATQILLEANQVGSPALEVLATELRGFANRFITNEKQLIHSRWERGLVIDGHGSLELSHLVLAQPAGKSVKPCFLGRAMRGAESRVRDILGEVSEFIIELEVSGYRSQSEIVEREFAELYADLYEEQAFLFSFVETSLRLAQRQLDRSHSLLLSATQNSANEALAFAERCLAAAYRRVVGYRRPTITVFTGLDCPTKGNTAWNFSRIVAADFLGVAGEGSSLGSLAVGLDFESIIGLSRERITDRVGVVIECALPSRAERLRLVKLAQQLDTPIVFVDCELGRAERLLAKPTEELETVRELTHLSERSFFWDEQLSGVPIRQLRIEASFEPVQVARYLVHQLRDSASRQCL